MWISKDVPFSVWSEKEWRFFLSRSTYQNGATHVLVGNKTWLLSVLPLIGESIKNKSVNIQKTQWLIVSTEQADEAFRRDLEENLPEMTKLLLLQESRPKNRRRKPAISPTSSESSNSSTSSESSNFSEASLRANLQVAIHLAEYPGDGGAAVLQWVGSWDGAKGLNLKDSLLQAKPPRHFHGRNLTLTTVHKPRVFEVRGPNNTLRTTLEEVDGYVAEVLRILQERFNFSTVLTTTNTFGSLQENGSWNGMMSALWKAEADLSPLDFSPSWARAQAVDFSEWFSTDAVIVISKAPQSLVKPFLVFEIFTLWVWFTIVVAAVITGAILWGIECFMQRALTPKTISEKSNPDMVKISLGEMVTSTLKLFLMQGSQRWGFSLTGRILASCFFLVAISVVALYQGYIIAFLTVPRKAAPINSAFDLMDRLPQVKPVVRKNTVYYHFVVNFETFAPIAANLEFQQDTFLNTWDFFQLIHRGRYALIDTYSSGVGRAASFETQGEECRFYISKNVLKADLDLMAHRQNSIFRESVDRALRQLRSFGIIERVKDAYYSTSCERETGKRDPIALGLMQVQGAFYVLMAGIIISFCGFIAEHVAALTIGDGKPEKIQPKQPNDKYSDVNVRKKNFAEEGHA
ncbi:glutamate receptor-like [Penaeus japonicus]|uniref:glutamate receptor-like n=1 Tax=Penaeus japonicus TaxID=27405 RepID=UPI001C71300C|nr:glutamate receptor-like [Penaeus japonicus]